MTDESTVSASFTTGGEPPRVIDARMSLGAAGLSDLFPEGPAFRRSLISYGVLLTLSAFVATFGLLQDSVASIIGAMVIAPLGGAILAMSGALVTGRTRWQAISLTQILISAVWVTGIAFLISLILPNLLALNPSLEARTQPNLLDLGIALAAGAAGAWVAARRTGSDALPGVAIAVALVPPLATAGICLELGRWDDAAGALLLFATNIAAILVIAALVFIASGAAVRPENAAERRRMRNGLIVSLFALAIITVPLIWGGVQNVVAATAALQGAPIVNTWIGERDLRVVAYSIDGDVITLAMIGSAPPDDVDALATSLSATLGRPVDVTIDFTVQTRIESD
jgi:uncharacterized hydrophobic protein (TIGR00271 family)